VSGDRGRRRPSWRHGAGGVSGPSRPARPAAAGGHWGRRQPARRHPTRGQASVELLGALPALLLLGLVLAQALAVGYAKVVAGSAAEAGALALAAGADARSGVREALPGWSRARARVTVGDESVEVRLRPPSPLRVVSRRLEVGAVAAIAEEQP
jgi:hypothetical protein